MTGVTVLLTWALGLGSLALAPGSDALLPPLTGTVRSFDGVARNTAQLAQDCGSLRESDPSASRQPHLKRRRGLRMATDCSISVS